MILCYRISQVSVGMTVPPPVSIYPTMPVIEPVALPLIPSAGLPYSAAIMDPDLPVMGLDYWMGGELPIDPLYPPAPVLSAYPGEWMGLPDLGEPSRVPDFGVAFEEEIGVINPPVPAPVPMFVPVHQQGVVVPPVVPEIHLPDAMVALGVLPMLGDFADESDPHCPGSPYTTCTGHTLASDATR